MTTWKPHALAKPHANQLELRIGDKVHSIAELPGVPVGTVAYLLVNLLPQALGITLPMAFLIGLLIGLGKLSADRETVAGWLLARMNAAPVKRTALAGMLATGAVVVGLVGTAAAAVDDEPSGPVSPTPGTAPTRNSTSPGIDSATGQCGVVNVMVTTTWPSSISTL